MSGASVDKLNVKIGVDISELQRNLKRCTSQLLGMQSSVQNATNKMKSSFDGLKDKVTTVTKAIGAAFAVKKIFEFGKAAIDAGSDLTEVQNVVDTVFGSMSETINEWSKNAMTAFGLSETSAKQFTSTMGAMLKSSGITGDSLKTMSINMAALSADMASFYNLDSETAFNKIRSGISGETEPLKQLGINMSVANMEAYALSQGITKSYNAMSQAEQMILRYNYLLSVTADAQHDFERTSSSWANQSKVLSENLSKLNTVIGQGLIQALTPLINLFNQLIAKVVEFAQVVMKSFGVGEEESGGLSDNAADAAAGIEDADKAAKKLKSTIGGFDELHIIGDEDSSDVNSLDSALAGLTPNSVYDSVSKGIDEISKKMQDFVDKLKEKLSPVVGLAEAIKNSFTDAFDDGLGDALINNLKSGFWNIVDIIGSVAQAFEQAWSNNNAGTQMIEAMGTALNNILGLFNSIGESIIKAFQSNAGVEWAESVINKITGITDMIAGIATGLTNAWNDNGVGDAYIQSVLEKWASVNNAIAAISETIGQVFASDVGSAFFAQIIELCTTWNNIVSAVCDSFTAVWMEAGLGESIVSKIIEIVTTLIGIVTDIGKHFLEAWNSAGTGEALLRALGELIDNILGFIKNIAQAWRDVWDNDRSTEIWSDLLGIVTDVVEGVGDLIGNIADALEESGTLQATFELIQDIIGDIVKFAKDLFDKFSEILKDLDWKPLTDAITAVMEAFHAIWDVVSELMDGPLGELLTLLMEIFGAGMQLAIYAIAGALKVIAAVLEGIAMIVRALLEPINALINGLGNIVGLAGSGLSSLSKGIASLFSVPNPSPLTAVDIPMAATGGIFGKGQMFIANERGPELVGSQNGQSVVMNNQQIVDAVSSGVASAVSPLIDAMQGGGTEQTVKIRGTDLLYILTKTQNRQGSSISSNFAFGGV